MCHKFSTKESDCLKRKTVLNSTIQIFILSKLQISSLQRDYCRHMAWRITVESRCLELNGRRLRKEIHCQSSSSKLSIGFSIPFYMDLFHDDRRPLRYNPTHVSIFHYKSKACIRLHSVCTKIYQGHSENLLYLLGAEIFIVRLSQGN